MYERTSPSLLGEGGSRPVRNEGAKRKAIKISVVQVERLEEGVVD